MMRSMFSGVSGLTSHQERMDVIGDNISNVNTVGYKGSNVNFAEMMALTEQAAQSPREDIGGTNPQQVGMGVEVGSIDTDITQGSLESTGVPTDAAIEGDGYFVVEDAEGRELYTRNGSFNTDAQGNLVTSAQGLRVQGWSETTVDDGDVVVDEGAGLGDIQINMGSSMPEGIDLATTEMSLDGNLDTMMQDDYITGRVVEMSDYDTLEDIFDSDDNDIGNIEDLQDGIEGALEYGWIDGEIGFYFEDDNGDILGIEGIDAEELIEDTPHHTSTFDIFDEQGQRHTIALDFAKKYQLDDAGDNENIDDEGSHWAVGMRLENLDDYGVDTGGLEAGDHVGIIDWDVEDYFADIRFDESGRLEEGLADLEDLIDEALITDYGDDLEMDTADLKFDGEHDIHIQMDDIMQQSDAFTLEGAAEDGYEPGVLDNFTLEGDGTIMGQYTNGLNAPIGQVALATFENPGGLTREGGSLFSPSANSGEASIGVAGTGGRGEIRAGTLEMSNVDLAEEFTDMIRTQRGYQANSSSITTSDEMLQELVNLAR